MLKIGCLIGLLALSGRTPEQQQVFHDRMLAMRLHACLHVTQKIVPTLLIIVIICNADRSLWRRQNFSGWSTGSRDLLQWAVGLQQQRRRRLFMIKVDVEA